MKAKITAEKLNVRSMPSLGGQKIGLLSKDTVVEILGHRNSWFEIKFNDTIGFVHDDYVIPIENETILKGRIKAKRLNVRNQPTTGAQILGSLEKDTVIDILDSHGDWLEIGFNDQSAFIHKDYVRFIEPGSEKRATVTADILNVRQGPNINSEILGSLTGGTEIRIISRFEGWFEIRFNDSAAFVHSDFVKIIGEVDSDGSAVFDSENAKERDADETSLTPEKKLSITGTKIEKKVTRTWNNLGGLLENLSGAYRIEPASAVAVLCVESSGKGFDTSNQNRMIIRFENHQFWNRWGNKNQEEFRRHFQYGKRENGRMKIWLGHRWRESDEDIWKSFHGDQAKEWEVLDFARSLNDTAALLSISMGAPQIMGFNYERIGYSNVQDMFERFNQDIRYQIQGLFDFFDDKMINALQARDFVAFAGYYNGAGQRDKYGGWIQNHYDAIRKLTA